MSVDSKSVTGVYGRASVRVRAKPIVREREREGKLFVLRHQRKD